MSTSRWTIVCLCVLSQDGLTALDISRSNDHEAMVEYLTSEEVEVASEVRMRHSMYESLYTCKPHIAMY